MNIDQETSKVLGFDELRRKLAGFTLTPVGRKICLEISPITDLEILTTKQQRYLQLAWLYDHGYRVPIESLDDIRLDLGRTRKGGVLDAEAVLRVAHVMRVSSRVREFVMNQDREATEALLDLVRFTHDLLPLATELLAAFDPDGQLRDSASVELMQLRRSAASLTDNIRNRLERMMRSARMAAILSDQYITQRGDRYVLPVRADARAEVEGIVHDASQSGATLFIEPAQIVDEGNKLKIKKAQVAEEERRILAEYSREIAEVTGDIDDNLRMLADVDFLQASLQLGRQLSASMPELVEGGFWLHQARHPLMVLACNTSDKRDEQTKRKVVANDVQLPPDRLALVVTGPNAGGKTVVLKTLGLCCLMAQAGLPIPAAEGSKIGVFNGLAAVVGDAQDIERGLSTFSAHIQRISQILTRAGPNTLVLLDELAADTDPNQGAALASAILNRLVERGAVVMVTTHFEQLKLLAYEDERFANASVGFDLAAMEPTFQLHPDVPGRSLTLDIAARLGLEQPVLDDAAGRLEKNEFRLDNILRTLEDERQLLMQQIDQLQRSQVLAAQAAASHEQSSKKLEQRRQELLGQGREQLLAEIASVRKEVAAVIESIRRGAEMKQAVQASHQLIALEAELNRKLARDRTHPLDDLQVGDKVRVQKLAGKVGLVTAVDRTQQIVSVRLGSIRTRVPLDQVELVEKKKKIRTPGPPRPITAGLNQPEAKVSEVQTESNTLDLRGFRVDEALAEVEKFLDQQFNLGQRCAFLVHGHGSGALKSAIRNYLKGSVYPQHFRAGTQHEGGDGVTVVRIK